MSNSSTQVYGGDEITAVIIDPGSYTTNIGYSGTDCPQVILPSAYGIQQIEGDDEAESSKTKSIFDEQQIVFPRPDYETKRIVENGMISDWDAAQEQWSWALEKSLYIKSNEGIPVLLTEPVWNTVENRRKSLEVLLEDFKFEACYLNSTPSCVSFASGKPTCLVVDVGHDTCSVSPVIDGMALTKSTKRNHIAGRYINHLLESYLKKNVRESDNKIIPLFMIEKRRPELILKKFDYSINPSLINHANTYEFFQECKETLCRIYPSESKLEKVKDDINALSKRSIETPWNENLIFDNMTCYNFGQQLFNPDTALIPEDWPKSNNGVVETWHNDYVPTKRNRLTKDNAEEPTKRQKTDENNFNTTTEKSNTDDKKPTDDDNEQKEKEDEKDNESVNVLGVAELVISTINSCDVDLRSALAHNVILTGGTSLIPGFGDRLLFELNKKLPALKFRILSSGQKRERKYQAWLGSSILTSLGTFHQLWVGKKEYEEVGADRLLRDRFR